MQDDQAANCPYREDDIVWAKVSGYPWWPASVHQSVMSDGLLVVNFIMHNSQ